METVVKEKERAINCYQHEVKAILDGRQSQLRRVIEPQPDLLSADGKPLRYKQITVVRDNNIEKIDHPDGEPDKRFVDVLQNPYQTGMRLWVRETWSPSIHSDGFDSDGGEAVHDCPAYKATETFRCGKPDPIAYKRKYKPSIHMPRIASRILLEIVSVRVERVKQISYVDVQAEGITSGGWDTPGFINLWDSINAKRGYGWDTNPWVFVIEFKVIN
jgi:hypothetical protein